MSVRLESINGNVGNECSNGTWKAIIALGRAYEGDKITAWDGTHDDHVWPTDQLELLAERLEQAARFVETLRELAKDGGVKIS